MSDIKAIHATSATLQKLLQDAIAADVADFGSPPPVTLQTPKEVGSQKGVSLWLYRVVRDEFLTNQSPERIAPDQVRRTPLPVRLHYLVTPLINGDAGEQQKLLGKILQVFYDTPILRGVALNPDLDPTRVELRVTLETLSLEDITRVWWALGSQSGYQLSVSYEVQVVEIDSAVESERVVPVIEVAPQYDLIVGSA